MGGKGGSNGGAWGDTRGIELCSRIQLWMMVPLHNYPHCLSPHHLPQYMCSMLQDTWRHPRGPSGHWLPPGGITAVASKLHKGLGSN